ncbi:MAG: OmpA family protein [Sulfuricurvum sp.]|nr:OmpA family protein [Sulfuricurvum sp.]
MNKIILSTLLASVALSASDYNYEVSPMVGYLWNSTANETGLHANGAMGGVEDHPVFGLDAQINNFSDVIKPELSVLYGRDRVTGFSDTTGVLTTMVNGVYEMNNISNITPFAKAGLGYEWYTNTHPSDYNGMLLDAGLGAKMDITKSIALKLEALYMYKMNNNGIDGSNGEVHNVAALAGLTFKFGATAAPMIAAVAAPVAAVVVAEPKPVVVTPAPVPVPAAKVCPLNVDSDHDGVFDPQDKCPNTPAGFKVDADGCPLKATLHLNFVTDGYSVDAAGIAKVKDFAAFLKGSPTYKATIVGHTDSTGSDKYNQTLSEKRAEKVKTMLIDQGIASDRLTTNGEGEKNPAASNKTKQGRAENRRIEVELCK